MKDFVSVISKDFLELAKKHLIMSYTDPMTSDDPTSNNYWLHDAYDSLRDELFPGSGESKITDTEADKNAKVLADQALCEMKAKLAEEVVEGWDMDTLINYAIEHLEDSYDGMSDGGFLAEYVWLKEGDL